MASWTPEQSTILSVLLDQVVGTQAVIEIRQDHCKIHDSLVSNNLRNAKQYFTGSKAEGLDLPGSDHDFMHDMNELYGVKIVQSLDNIPETSSHVTFFMSTENIRPGFALLQHVNQKLTLIKQPFLFFAFQKMNDVSYLSSNSVVDLYKNIKSWLDPFTNGESFIRARQGPSVETWGEFHDKSESGIDDVFSIHCDFWPKVASEWTQRARNFGWPAPRDISSIVAFGCHVVPVGHPHSETKLNEWRISFSVAERTLVWAFNHVQMQCYAVLKIILKEFIKVKCSPQNQFLCSYFIKTFLFWKYEASEPKFWREDNFRECIMYLLTEFSKCIREGVLSHYFIPTFNLLSVKITRAAQTELLQLFDIIIQSDIRILRECRTLQKVWSEFVENRDKGNVFLHCLKKKHRLTDDECIMQKLYTIVVGVLHDCTSLSRNDVARIYLSLPCKTNLKTLVLETFLFKLRIKTFQGSSENRCVYKLHRFAHNETFSFDLSSCKLWCAILLLMKRDYSTSLSIINKLLSSISPYTLYLSGPGIRSCNETKRLYMDRFMINNNAKIKRSLDARSMLLEGYD